MRSLSSRETAGLMPIKMAHWEPSKLRALSPQLGSGFTQMTQAKKCSGLYCLHPHPPVNKTRSLQRV